MFLTVPPTPALRIALAAAFIWFWGTCNTLLGALLLLSRLAAAYNPTDEPLRSTSVARPPPLVRASRRRPPEILYFCPASGASRSSFDAAMCFGFCHCNSPLF